MSECRLTAFAFPVRTVTGQQASQRAVRARHCRSAQASGLLNALDTSLAEKPEYPKLDADLASQLISYYSNEVESLSRLVDRDRCFSPKR